MTYVWVTSFLLAGISVAAIVLIGVWIMARHDLAPVEAGGVDWRWLLPPAIGWMATAAIGQVALVLGVGIYVGIVIPVMMAAALADARKVIVYWSTVAIPRAPLILVVVATFVQMGTMLVVERGPLHGADVFWTIYRFAHVTPGDSSQALLQAQYLIHGADLDYGRVEFSIFDRTFGAGVMTAEIMCALLRCPGQALYETREPFAQTYVGIWICFNAVAVAAIWQLARILAPARATAIVLLLCASPFIVFNGLGLWPKLFAFYLLIVACGCAWSGRIYASMLFSSAAFLTHASFLWPHLALACAAAAFLLTGEKRLSRHDLQRAAGVLGLAAVVPLVWFGSQHLAGGFSPLRYYYLYDVPPFEALHREPADIIRSFYKATSPENLIALPIIGLFKALTPQSVLHYLLTFSYKGDPFSVGDVFRPLQTAMEQRIPYAFGLTLGFVSIAGIVRFWRTRWIVPALVLVLFVMPLVPATGLYRQNDHFSTPVMLFAVAPVIAGLCLWLDRVGSRAFLLIGALSLVEFAGVFMVRMAAPYYGDSVDLLKFVPIPFSVATMAVLYMLTRSVQPSPAQIPAAQPGLVLLNWKLPTVTALSAACLVTLVLIPFMPPLVLAALKDGGFRAHGRGANLLKWRDVTVERQKGAYSGMLYYTVIGGKPRAALWVQAGQSLRFGNIPTGPEATVAAYVGMVAADEHSRSILVEFEIAVVDGDSDVAKTVVTLHPAANPEDRNWREARLSLAQFSGRPVDVVFRTRAALPVLIAWGELRVVP
jgi:hypothetical protein